MSATGSIVREFADLDALSSAAADEFRLIAIASVTARDCCRVVLPGGNTPRRLFEMLATPTYRNTVPWDRLEFYWGDERMVPPDDPDSNFRMANEALLAKVPLHPAAVHRVQTESGSPEEVASGYAVELSQLRTTPNENRSPVFDVILLGMGSDGHTASLFPHSPVLGHVGQWVVPSRAPKPPHERITMTAEVINAAREVIFLVSGADKAEVLAQVLEGPADAQRLPAQLSAPSHGRLLWFVDSAAASKLTRAGQQGRFRV
ncbi:MAG: 6-phosphogluconolactonase [candidate division Zixibacteria bacterium]|nr:6-phosphogluconolactonase [candidate division Zixibacteria bacterium]